MSAAKQSGGRQHPDAEALDRYRRRAAPPAELLETDAHVASCDRCYEAVRAEIDAIELPAEGQAHVTYEELEAFVDGRTEALDRELLAAHVAFCALCCSDLNDLAATRDVMALPGVRALHEARLRPRT